MNPWWLLLPYVIFVPIEGARFILLELSSTRLLELNNPIQIRLYRFRALDIPWYKWLSRSIKDWLVLGILGGATVSGLLQLLPQTVSISLALMGSLLFLRSFAPVVLLLFSAGVGIPSIVLAGAIRLAVPDYVPANRKRVVLWGGVFVLAGTASLWVWAGGSNSNYLLWGFFSLTLGFISLLSGAKFISETMEGNSYAEKAG